jgi:hypothetical protein
MRSGASVESLSLSLLKFAQVAAPEMSSNFPSYKVVEK